jgi:hypothetical protein
LEIVVSRTTKAANRKTEMNIFSINFGTNGRMSLDLDKLACVVYEGQSQTTQVYMQGVQAYQWVSGDDALPCYHAIVDAMEKSGAQHQPTTDSDPMCVPAGNPPQKNVHCPSCGYRGVVVKPNVKAEASPDQSKGD